MVGSQPRSGRHETDLPEPIGINGSCPTSSNVLHTIEPAKTKEFEPAVPLRVSARGRRQGHTREREQHPKLPLGGLLSTQAVCTGVVPIVAAVTTALSVRGHACRRSLPR